MPKELITICTVNWYSYKFLIHLFGNLYEKADNKSVLKFLIIDNTNGQDEKIKKLAEQFNSEIVKNDSKGLKGSYGHASGLNLAMKRIDTKFALVIDPDVYVFKEKWDTFLIDLIDNSNFIAAGVSYPKWQLGKYHDFPNPVFCFFKTREYLELNPDWMPFEANLILKAWDFIRRNTLRLGLLINRKTFENSKFIRNHWARLEKVIGICSKDTGWKIARNASKNNLKSITFNAALRSTIPKDSSFYEIAKEFELYYYNNEPVAAHKYSTSSILWKTGKGKSNDYWCKCIERFQNDSHNINNKSS